MRRKEISLKALDTNKLKNGLENLIKSSDPYEKWLQVLNEIKPQLLNAKERGISLSKISKTLKDNGARVPNEVLKKFIES